MGHMSQLPDIPESMPVAVVPDGRGNMVVISQNDAGRINRARISPTGEVATGEVQPSQGHSPAGERA